MTSRLNWNARQGPGEFDNSAPETPTYEFDLTRSTVPGTPSWPTKVQGQTFGPTFIEKAWKSGLVVVAEIDGLPYPVAATETRWSSKVLVVRCSEGWRIPSRIWTRTTVRGLDSTGLLIEGDKS